MNDFSNSDIVIDGRTINPVPAATCEISSGNTNTYYFLGTTAKGYRFPIEIKVIRGSIDDKKLAELDSRIKS
jgi:hypothetical protein